MLARHRSKGDEAEQERIAGELKKLSTDLLLWLLDEDQLTELRRLERDGQ
jgi:hypothetical protein